MNKTLLKDLMGDYERYVGKCIGLCKEQKDKVTKTGLEYEVNLQQGGLDRNKDHLTTKEIEIYTKNIAELSLHLANVSHPK